jgi:hypothetical protein
MGQPLIGMSARLSEKLIKAGYWVAIVATSDQFGHSMLPAQALTSAGLGQRSLLWWSEGLNQRNVQGAIKKALDCS